MAAADVYNDSNYSSNNNLILTIELERQRRWYYTSYQFVRMLEFMEPSGVTSNGVQAKIYAHVSGKIDSESQLFAESSNSTIGADYGGN